MRDRVPFLLYRSAAASLAMANEMLEAIGLEARQVGILTLVTERGPMTQKALGTDLQIDRSTMVRLLDDLEARGLVERHRHPRDRRAFLVRPTSAGEDTKVEAVRILDDQQQIFLEPLEGHEREALADLLSRLYVGAQKSAGRQ